MGEFSRQEAVDWLAGSLTDLDKVRAIEEDLQTENSQVQEVLEEMAERARRVAKMRDIGGSGHLRSPGKLSDNLDFTAPIDESSYTKRIQTNLRGDRKSWNSQGEGKS